MITKEQLQAVTKVFFHASCPDGTASAMIIADAFTASDIHAKFYSVQYGTDFHNNLRPEPGQLFVDITPPLTRWQEWAPFNPIVLDHHATAQSVTEGLSGIYATNEKHSGAMLAYERVMLTLVGYSPKWAAFANLAMVRDTWKSNSEFWSEAQAQAQALTLFDSDILIEQVSKGTFDFISFMETGRVLLKAAERNSRKLARGAFRTSLILSDGTQYNLAAFNCTDKSTSDVGNLLQGEGADIAIGYFYMMEDGTDKLVCSIRSNGRVSARKIAESFGGGGHDKAAGFQISGMGAFRAPSYLVDIISNYIKITSTPG